MSTVVQRTNAPSLIFVICAGHDVAEVFGINREMTQRRRRTGGFIRRERVKLVGFDGRIAGGLVAGGVIVHGTAPFRDIASMAGGTVGFVARFVISHGERPFCYSSVAGAGGTPPGVGLWTGIELASSGIANGSFGVGSNGER